MDGNPMYRTLLVVLLGACFVAVSAAPAHAADAPTAPDVQPGSRDPQHPPPPPEVPAPCGSPDAAAR